MAQPSSIAGILAPRDRPTPWQAEPGSFPARPQSAACGLRHEEIVGRKSPILTRHSGNFSKNVDFLP
jgi:hypothetical protein